MTRLTRLLALARTQHNILTIEELRSLGYSKDGVAHLIATHRLVRVHVGVYALEGPLTDEGRALAAVRRMEPRCALSHLSAAALRGYRTWWPVRPQVIVARPGGVTGPKSIHVHRSSTLTRADVEPVLGIPTTSVTRTILDSQPLLSLPQLKSLVWSAEQDGLDLEALERPGIPRQLRALLKTYVAGAGLTANELEARFFELCARGGLDRPEIQGSFPEDRRVDFVWHDIRLIVETDGRRSHGTAIAFTEDRRRDRQHFIRSGYVTVRFTWAEVRYDPEAVLRDLLATVARLRRDD